MITSTRNPRIVQARKLTARKHRLRQNRFLVEGLQLLGMAVEMMATPTGRQKIIPLELFYSQELFSGPMAPHLLERLTAAGAEPVPTAARVLDTLSEREVSQGLAAVFARQPLLWTLEELEPVLTGTDGLVLVLDRLQDPGNLGTLIRTADAVGAQAVFLLEPCVDPFDPKTVRGTMGSLFTVPLVSIDRPGDLFGWLGRLGYRAVGADAAGTTVWQSEALSGRVALVLGNEARGLSPDLRERLAEYVSLPILGHAESLNVAVAGGALMYEWLRRTTRRDKAG
ncbi:MAG: RNA methyltransferase [Chloroflexi bacterium]|nr:MAG: RNA methyltransferase [Chloroflexota bacterium]